MSFTKSDSLKQEIYYGTLGQILTTCQAAQGAKGSRILNFTDIDEAPLTGAAQIPSQHVAVAKYFHFPGLNKQFSGMTIPQGRTRGIECSFLFESDANIDEVVDTVQIDLIDLLVMLEEVKTVQAISHESRLHLVRVYNRFNRIQVERALQKQLQEFQEAAAEFDKNSFLGALEDANIKFPKLSVKLDYPFNAPYEKRKDGEDSRFKRTWIIEYALLRTIDTRRNRFQTLQSCWEACPVLG